MGNVSNPSVCHFYSIQCLYQVDELDYTPELILREAEYWSIPRHKTIRGQSINVHIEINLLTSNRILRKI